MSLCTKRVHESMTRPPKPPCRITDLRCGEALTYLHGGIETHICSMQRPFLHDARSAPIYASAPFNDPNNVLHEGTDARFRLYTLKPFRLPILPLLAPILSSGTQEVVIVKHNKDINTALILLHQSVSNGHHYEDTLFDADHIAGKVNLAVAS